MSGAARRRFEHVVFDLDGTLVDTGPDLVAATNHVRASFGLPPLPPSAVYPLVGEGARRLVERALGASDATQVDEGVRRFLDYYEVHLLDATVLYPGIANALDCLAARGVVLSVLTNKPERLSRRILDGLGIGDRFVTTIGGDTLPTRKPDPAGIARIRADRGNAGERLLLVGDSVVDLATAAAAGIDFCGVAWGFAPAALRAARPQNLVEDAAELVELVTAAGAG